jgi:acetyltransferase-like isoleucine patch superfamily enzyme
MYSFFWVTPIYKGFFTNFGKEFKAGNHVPFVLGKGKIFLGDKVTFFGKVDFIFGNIRDKVPEIHIGNKTGIGHNVSFDISDTLIIGDNCLIAEGVSFHDSHGHHLDPALRLKQVPIDEKQIRPIKIGNNVWIADGAFISPGTTIGDNCIISAKTIVGRNIPANHIVYPGPNKIAKLRNISGII